VLDELKLPRCSASLKVQVSGTAELAAVGSLIHCSLAAAPSHRSLLKWQPGATRLRRLTGSSDARSNRWAAEQAHDWGGSGRPTVCGSEHSHVRTVGEQAAEKAVLSAWGWRYC
jgi:hypothetical protein